MKLTTSQKAALVLLGLAATVLGVDRFVLGTESSGPREAEAAAPAPPASRPPAAAPAPAASAPAVAESAPAPGSRSVAEHLLSLATAQGLDPALVREAFVPAESWLSQLKKPVETAATAAPAGPDPAAVFAEKHKLSSIVRSAGSGSVILDGRLLRVGEERDGFRLVRLGSDRAVFRAVSGGAEAELRLPGPGQ